MREGIDDVRYVTTLARLADTAAGSGNAAIRAQGDATRAYLDRLWAILREGRLGEDAYNDLRREIAARIAALDLLI